MTLSLSELIIALVGTGLLSGLGSAFVSGWFSRRKSGGEASQAFAEAARLVAEQNETLLLRVNEQAGQLTQVACDYKVLGATYELLKIELQKRDAKIELLQMEVSKLRIALGLNNKPEQ